MFGSVALSYDAENRQTPAGVNSYLYDGAGRRVSKTTGGGRTTFVYDAFGQLAAEYAGGTVWSKDYIRHVGQVVAIENASGSPCTTCYLSLDLLGGVRMVTDQSANVTARHDYAPFGQEIQAGVGPRTSLWDASDNVNQKFTGQERDGETNLDFLQARYLSSGIGRFNSPDPGNAGADLTNPQSWNGYAYVLNNPLTMIDPSGLDPFSPGDPGDPGDGCDDNDWCGGFPWPTGPGGPVTPPPPPPRQAESGGGNTLPRGSFPGGETLGLPPGIGVPSTLQLLLGGGYGTPCDFGACNGIIQIDASGLPAGSVNASAIYSAVAAYLSQSRFGKSVWDKLANDPKNVWVVKLNGAIRNNTLPGSKVINWDPSAGLVCPGGGRQSPALGLFHELFHKTPGHLSNLADEERRAIAAEQQVAADLGECIRWGQSGAAGGYSVMVPTVTSH